MSSALLFGFAAGMALSSSDPLAAFKVSTGADLLFETGPVVVARVEATHVADLLFQLGAGWYTRGLRENEGLPLGLSLAPVLGRAHEGELSLGGRVQLAYGLYFARVAIEVDATMLAPIGRDARESPILSVGVGLRFVPWSPWRL